MKVMVVDDHPLVRKGLLQVLTELKEVKKFYEASNVSDAVQILKNYKPDISFIDIKLGREDGLEIVNWAKSKSVDLKFIILTSSVTKNDFTRAQKLGVDGYVLKDAYMEDLIYAFHVVLRGKKFFDPDIMQANNDNGIELLTQREREVLNQLGKGLTNQMIAKELYISENTVKKHISSILYKLELNHRTEAALLAKKVLNEFY